MAQIETMKIKAAGPKGFMIINKADFDPKKYQHFVEPKPEGDNDKGDGKGKGDKGDGK